MSPMIALLATAQPAGGVPAPVMKKLDVGVNVTRWFCYLADPKDTSHFVGYLKPADYAHLRRLKVSYVRLCVSPEAIYEAGKPNRTNLPYLDRAIEQLDRNQLLTLLDLHDNGQMKLAESPESRAGFVTFWEAMARHYRGKRLNSVAFELVNEPVFEKNPEEWIALQERTVKAIRQIDPKRTIVVTGANWGGVDGLAKLQPLKERNLIYSFHFYDPFWFTHQGATWAGDAAKAMAGVPFPSDPETVEPVAARTPKPYDDYLRDYGRQRWNDAKLRERIAIGRDWGRQHGVPVFMGEFGAYPPAAPPEARARWFAGMRQANRELEMPAALWGYDDGLGLGRRVEPDGSVWLDPLVMRHYYGVR